MCFSIKIALKTATSHWRGALQKTSNPKDARNFNYATKTKVDIKTLGDRILLADKKLGSRCCVSHLRDSTLISLFLNTLTAFLSWKVVDDDLSLKRHIREWQRVVYVYRVTCRTSAYRTKRSCVVLKLNLIRHFKYTSVHILRLYNFLVQAWCKFQEPLYVCV